MSDWIEWDGNADCPVDRHTLVRVRFPNGGEAQDVADKWAWRWPRKSRPTYGCIVGYAVIAASHEEAARTEGGIDVPAIYAGILSSRFYVTNTDTTVTMHFKVQNQVFAAMKALAALAPAIVRSEPRKPAKRVAIEPKATPRPAVDLVGPGAPRK